MNVSFSAFYQYIDPLFISFYRVTGDAMLDYFIGTTCLAMICVVLGELCVSLAIKLNKRPLDTMTEEMVQKEKLSMAAYQAGDKTSYRALNKEATDLWGKKFFTAVGYSAGILWPIPFALGWMATRFQAVDFELAYPLSLVFGQTVGYTFTFIPIYILCRIIFKYLRPRLPYFKGVQKLLSEYDDKPAR